MFMLWIICLPPSLVQITYIRSYHFVVITYWSNDKQITFLARPLIISDHRLKILTAFSIISSTIKLILRWCNDAVSAARIILCRMALIWKIIISVECVRIFKEKVGNWMQQGLIIKQISCETDYLLQSTIILSTLTEVRIRHPSIFK